MTNDTKQVRSYPLQKDLMRDVYYRLAESYINELLADGVLRENEALILHAQNLSVYRPFLYQLVE